MARASHRPEDRRKRRRRRFGQTLLWGTAAVGIPALANALIARRNRKLDGTGWGRRRRYAWKLGEIAFQQAGDGAPIVLVHSFGPGYDSEQWHDAGLAIAERHRVFAPDLLGWGHSDKPAVRYDGELYIQALRDFLEEVVRERATVIGVGLTASYAVQVAVDYPELVAGLGLVCPIGLGPDTDEPDLTDALTNRALRLPLVGTTTLNLYTSRAAIARHLRREVYFAADRLDTGRVEHHYRSSHQPGSHLALAAQLSGYLNHAVESSLPRLDQPVWLAWGRASTSPPVEAADLWLSRLPGAGLDVFDSAGRLPHLEVPRVFADRLFAFLDRTSGR